MVCRMIPDRRRPLAALLIAITLCHATAPALAQSSDCSSAIETARDSYFEGRFDKAIDSLDRCLNEGAIPLERRPEAFRMLGLCYVAKDYEGQARTAIHQLLLLTPNWQPDPVEDPAAFQSLVASVRQEMSDGRLVSPGQTSGTAETGSKKKWWLWGGLAAAGGAIAAVLLSGGDDGGDDTTNLPDPPALPGE